MLALLLAAAAPAPTTAIDAERAFAAMAQAKGQWTAFRHYAAPEGMMFVPEPVKAQDWLKDRKDPPQPLRWSPTASYVSCDGSFAVNTGEWRGGKAAGYFTTFWQRKVGGGWHWLIDAGDTLATARKPMGQPLVRRAACTGKPSWMPGTAFQVSPPHFKRGASADGTLAYEWYAQRDHSRVVQAWLWTGSTWDKVIDDHVAAPK